LKHERNGGAEMKMKQTMALFEGILQVPGSVRTKMDRSHLDDKWKRRVAFKSGL
jgi:hypothetical protein